MIRKWLCLGLCLSFLGARSQTAYTALTDSFIQALNQRSYHSVETFLSPEFEIQGMDRRTSLLQFYSYIHYHKPDSHYIRHISALPIAGPGNTDTLRGTITYQNGKTGPLEFITQRGAVPKIQKILSGWMPSFHFVTRASYVEQDLFGEDPIRQIKNLKLVDYRHCDSLSRDGYTVYFEEPFRDLAFQALSSLALVDSVLRLHGIVHITRESLLLVVAARSAVIMGADTNIPWTISLKAPVSGVDPAQWEAANRNQVLDRIAHTISHEIAENSLVTYYNMGSIRFRWFRDGLSDLIAYSYAAQHNPKVAQDYFLKARLKDARVYRQTGHLLDWRGRGPNAREDIGARYGDRYLYENEAGQYGRSFRFFLDLQQRHGTAKIAALMGLVEAHKEWLSGEDLHQLFRKSFGLDLVRSLARY